MPEPVIVARANHPISRKDIDPDALRVLYRLHEHHHAAYLVGGSVRDLLLGRHPKDFDIGTSAHPYQIKKLFRNCWIIGRRFRLAHIKYGAKTIEVATFRKNIPDAPPGAPDPTDAALPDDALVVASSPAPEPEPEAAPEQAGPEHTAPEYAGHGDPGGAGGHAAIHRDNTFGTAEEDAFRRDFTVNALFYDIGTYSIIDYVGGLEDLERRVIRSIGDPRVRFVEDPVRMMRAVVFAARLGFDLDRLVLDAIDEHRALIATASPSRLIEEYYKILRSGFSESIFRSLKHLGLLELITPELKSAPDTVWQSLTRLDAWRTQFTTAPAELTNTVLIGSLLVPMDAVAARRPMPRDAGGNPHIERVSFGMLPVARKDIERLRHVAQIAPRLTEPDLPPRLIRSIVNRPSFDDALLWLEIFGDDTAAVARWKEARQHRAPQPRHPPRPQHHHHPHPHGQPHHGHAHGQPPQGQRDAGDAAHDQAQGHHPPGDGQRRRRRRRRGGRRRGGRGGGGAGGGGAAPTG